MGLNTGQDEQIIFKEDWLKEVRFERPQDMDQHVLIKTRRFSTSLHMKWGLKCQLFDVNH